MEVQAITGSTRTRASPTPGDKRLAQRIAKKIDATDTVGLIQWTADARAGSPGVMRESETRVGAQGHRLGEFVGSAPIRDRTVRLILEAGNISNPAEAAYIRDPRWVRDVYAVAQVDALEEEFGTFSAQTPVLKPPTPTYAKPVIVPELKQYEKRPVETIPLVVRAEVPSPDGTTKHVEKFVRAWTTVKAEVPIGRLQTLDPDGPRVWQDIKVGEPFFVPFVGFNEGRPYTRTFFGTVIYLDGTDLAIAS